MELKKKLSQLRKEKGLTQLELAEALNVSRQAVSRWEVGTAVPSLDNLACLSRLYGVPLDDLITDHTDEEQLEKLPEPSTSALDVPVNSSRFPASFACLFLAVLILGVGILIGLSLRKGPDEKILLYTAPQIDTNSQITVGWLEKTPADRSDEAQWLETISGEASEETRNLS